MSIVKSLPERTLTTAEVEAMRQNDRFERVTTVLEFDGQVISLVVQVGETVQGLHCDHDTGEWTKTVRGEDFEEVLADHEEWLDDDMDRVLGGAGASR